MVSLFIYIVANVLLAAVPANLAALFILRVVQGFGGASVLSLGAGTVADIVAPKNRGAAMSLVLLGPQYVFSIPARKVNILMEEKMWSRPWSYSRGSYCRECKLALDLWILGHRCLSPPPSCYLLPTRNVAVYCRNGCQLRQFTVAHPPEMAATQCRRSCEVPKTACPNRAYTSQTAQVSSNCSNVPKRCNSVLRILCYDRHSSLLSRKRISLLSYRGGSCVHFIR